MGLSVSIGICLLIYQYVQHELSYDGFHENTAKTYRVRLDHYRNSSMFSSEVLTSPALGRSAIQTIPEIQNMVRIRPMHEDEGVVVQNPFDDKSFLEYNLYYVDDSFFDVFNYPFKSGDPEHALEDIKSIVLTTKTAEKYFGDSEAI